MVRQDNVVARDIMVPTKKLVTLQPDMDSLSAVRMLLKHGISGAPVVDESRRYLGVFSEKTSMQFLLRLTYEDLPSSDVRSFMNTDLNRTIGEELDLLSIIEVFLQTPYRRLPVLDGEFLAGQISRRDVLKAATDSLSCPRSESMGRQLLYLSALHRLDDITEF